MKTKANTMDVRPPLSVSIEEDRQMGETVRDITLDIEPIVGVNAELNEHRDNLTVAEESVELDRQRGVTVRAIDPIVEKSVELNGHEEGLTKDLKPIVGVNVELDENSEEMYMEIKTEQSGEEQKLQDYGIIKQRVDGIPNIDNVEPKTEEYTGGEQIEHKDNSGTNNVHVEPATEEKIRGDLNKQMTGVMYVESTRDDTLLYCYDCQQDHKEHCPAHGPLIVIQNMKVEENDPDRALHSLPPNLLVKESDIVGAGLGVFTDTEIQPGTTYGPYEGMYITDPELANASEYCWQIYKQGSPSPFIDGKDTACSNWMRYVNCALSELDQNLMAFQYKGEIFYRCIKPILPKTELLVWYGNDCARKLGITKNISGFHRDACSRIESGQHSFSCSKGNGPFDNNSALFDTKLYKCKFCGDTKYSNISSSSLKTSLNLRELSYICLDCERTFDYKSRLTQKKDLLSKEKLLMCKVCDKKFRFGSKLEYHMRKHSGVKPYTCEVCDKKFRDKQCLTRHERIHTGEKPYICKVCDKAFGDKSALTYHQMNHTGQKPFKCKFCDKAFTNRSNLVCHERIHTGEKPYKCFICDKAFGSKSDLTRHERKHTGEKPYKCNLCDMAFHDKSALTYHERIHTSQKPFKCKFCDKTYRQKSHVTVHKRIHTGEKPYKCNFCDKVFGDKSHLTYHEKIHKGEKPYKCKFCDKTFRQKSHVTVHERIHT